MQRPATNGKRSFKTGRNRLQRVVSSVAGIADLGPWQTSYTYDQAARLATVQDNRVSPSPFQYAWKSGANLVDHITMPGGNIVQQKDYDVGGRLTGISLNYQQSPINSLTYGYNALSLRESEQNDIINGNSRSFIYDPQRQLKEVHSSINPQSGNLTHSYAYDPIGNWQSLEIPGTEVTGTFTANSVNQYTSIRLPGVGATYIPTYDDNGNMTFDGNDKHYAWNDENRLKAVTTGSNRVEFSYNGLGWRVEKRVYAAPDATTPQKVTRFVYDGVNLAEELDYSPVTTHQSLLRSYTLGLDLSQTFEGAGGVGGLLAVTDFSLSTNNSQPSTFFYSYDGNGNVTDLVDGGGTVVAHYEYSPFGSVVTKTGGYADINPFRWSTKYQDDETGLVYYGLRYYSPGMGRWISRDPIEEDGGLNIYGFVNNAPIDLYDSIGLTSNDYNPPPDSTVTPYQLGYEWLSGNGPRHREFKDGDKFTELLRKHNHIQNKIKEIRGVLETRCKLKNNSDFRLDGENGNYSLGGVEGIFKYIRDYSTGFIPGAYGNLAVTFLGSYEASFQVTKIDCCKGSAHLKIDVNNKSTLASSLHPPIIGYTKWWHRYIDPRLNSLEKSPTSQHIEMNEKVNFAGTP